MATTLQLICIALYPKEDLHIGYQRKELKVSVSVLTLDTTKVILLHISLNSLRLKCHIAELLGSCSVHPFNGKANDV